MCGIIFAESFINRDITPVILLQYEEQKNRGMQGFGLYDRNKNHLVRSTTEHGIKKWLKKYKASSILFHHRWPTSTDNVKNACHPFSTKDYFATNYVLVHNGVITNAYELYGKHTEMGIEYHSLQEDGTFNDSEALLWDVALYLEGQQDELKARGEIAFICIATPADGRKSKHLYFARNSNPINMLLDEKNFIFLSSEGDGEPIDPNTLYSYNYKSRKLETKPLTVPTRYIFNNNNYSNYHASDYNSGNWWDDDPRYTQNTLLDEEYWEEQEAQTPVYGYKLLPDTLAITYKKVIEGTFDSRISINNEMVNISARIRNKVQFYLKEGFGLYEMAAEIADDDFNNVCGQLIQDEQMGFIEDEDLVLERDIIVAAIEVLFSSPYWIGRNSVDPGYESLEAIEEQAKLLTA